MKQITDIVNNKNVQQLADELKKTISGPSIAIDNDSKQAKVFLSFKYYYGALWLSQLEETEYSEEAIKRMWVIALKDLSKEQVDDGVKKIMMGGSRFSSYPPKPGEFVELCRPVKEERAYYGPTYKLEWNGVTSSKETAAKAIAEIRTKFGLRKGADT